MTSLTELGRDIEPLPGSTASAGEAPPQPNQGAGTGPLAQLRRWLALTQAAPAATEPRRARMVHLGPGEGCALPLAELAQLGVRTVPATIRASEPGQTGADAGVADQLAAGGALADAEVDSGADLVVLSLPGAEILGPVLVCVLTGIEPVKVLPRGARLAAAEWTRRAVAVRDARRSLMPVRDDPDALLAAACRVAAELADLPGGAVCSLAAACGLLLRATARRTPVLLDGVGAAAAALLCAEVAADAAPWWRAADLGTDPAHDAAIAHLASEAVLPVPVDGDGGSAAALAVLTLRVAVRSAA
jgi:nicotinate-nucleotide--dimethylbenzimidazole phosphoribosyltransferase